MNLPMQVNPFQPQPFFQDKNRAFWNLQSLGWAGAFILRATSGLANGQPFSFLVPVLISTITGFSLTLLMAVIFRWLLGQRPVVTWTVTIFVVLAAAALGAFIDAWVFTTQNRGSDIVSVQLLLGAYYLTVTLLFAWSALYYAINFYLTVEEQADQLLHLENQASSAQLAMLRYQLNPHFLFNTLNAISTLVLDGDNQTANRMVTSLSAFLRHSLDADPMQRVTLKQELDALNLYLGIEKVRFAERLTLRSDVDDDAYGALLPSLLLQPLIENAIKYAVAKRIEGGTIEIAARRIGDMLEIQVRDDGPGCPHFTGGDLPPGNGVGLRNAQERLRVLYGERQAFIVRNREPRGVEITLRLPFEHALGGTA